MLWRLIFIVATWEVLRKTVWGSNILSRRSFCRKTNNLILNSNINDKRIHIQCSTQLKSFPRSLDTKFQSILDALYSDNKNYGLFSIEDVINGRPVSQWPQSRLLLINKCLCVIKYANTLVEVSKMRWIEYWRKNCCFQLNLRVDRK